MRAFQRLSETAIKGADWQEVPRGYPGPQAQGHSGAAGQT